MLIIHQRKQMNRIIFALILSFSTTLKASSCANWSPARRIAELPSNILDEVSGMQYSKIGNTEYLYYINDSGGGPFIYRSSLDGSNLRKIKISGYSEVDPEAIGLGNCPGSNLEKCVYLADIGDNVKIRSRSQIIILKENDFQKDIVSPLKIIHFKFPERTDAESLAVHPNGEIYIATKKKGMSTLFRLNLTKGEILENIGNIDFEKIEGHDDSSRATDMSISPDGKSFAILTYQDAILFNIDLGQKNNKTELTSMAQVLHIEVLPKQESITFTKNDRLLYSTEAKEGSAPIYESRCSSI